MRKNEIKVKEDLYVQVLHAREKMSGQFANFAMEMAAREPKNANLQKLAMDAVHDAMMSCATLPATRKWIKVHAKSVKAAVAAGVKTRKVFQEPREIEINKDLPGAEPKASKSGGSKSEGSGDGGAKGVTPSRGSAESVNQDLGDDDVPF